MDYLSCYTQSDCDDPRRRSSKITKMVVSCKKVISLHVTRNSTDNWKRELFLKSIGSRFLEKKIFVILIVQRTKLTMDEIHQRTHTSAVTHPVVVPVSSSHLNDIVRAAHQQCINTWPERDTAIGASRPIVCRRYR